jgi:hypothetical protein
MQTRSRNKRKHSVVASVAGLDPASAAIATVGPPLPPRQKKPKPASSVGVFSTSPVEPPVLTSATSGFRNDTIPESTTKAVACTPSTPEVQPSGPPSSLQTLEGNEMADSFKKMVAAEFPGNEQQQRYMRAVLLLLIGAMVDHPLPAGVVTGKNNRVTSNEPGNAQNIDYRRAGNKIMSQLEGRGLLKKEKSLPASDRAHLINFCGTTKNVSGQSAQYSCFSKWEGLIDCLAKDATFCVPRKYLAW